MGDSTARSVTEFDALDRNRLRNSGGVTFPEFRKTLRPLYARVWRDIAIGYLALALAVALAVEAQAHWGLYSLALAPALACLVGYSVAYLQLFFHEAGHFNIAPGRRRNDLLANLFIGSFVGQDVGSYRIHHFDHRFRRGRFGGKLDRRLLGRC